ncbi:MAG: adenine-specific methyltransferase EcoRI family protein [Chitinispirillales bacterium]|jgi:hypothetical protein|nr:adenine-specific methyltransferase EcoRI family protein [Chitinispirillales bacterium]
MANNSKLSKAKNAKNDEFYTQWVDIEKEVQAYLDYAPDVFKGKTILCPCDDPYESNFFKYFALRFNDLGLKKLIATCYAGSPIANTQLSLFADEPVEDRTTKSPHKIEITEVGDYNNDGSFDLKDIEWLLENKKNVLTRLEGNGDFRSDEVRKLRDEADVIVTNPPFSLFREFFMWIMQANKSFIVIANKNCVTYKEVFPFILKNKIWSGITGWGGGMWFESKNLDNVDKVIDGIGMKNVASIFLSNLEHGRRHQSLPLMTMADNLRYNNGLKKKLEDKREYDTYDNYDAIDIPYTDAIPSDYNGAMGVPISFLEKYCPEQFEIIALGNSRENFTPIKNYVNPKKIMKDGKIVNGGAINCVLAIETDVEPQGQTYYTSDNSKYLIPPYARIIIKHKRVTK